VIWGSRGWWRGHACDVTDESLARRLLTLFDANGGVATVEELAAAGLAPERLRRLERRGVMASTRRGIYAPRMIIDSSSADSGRSHALQVATVSAATSANWVASHQSAAVMHGLDLLGHASETLVTVTQAGRGGGNQTGYAGVRVRVAEVPDRHATKRFGVPCTTVARTVVDLARSETFMAGVAVADSALHKKKTTPGELAAVLAQCAGWPGVVNARRAVAFCDGRSESVLESVGRVAMHELGLEPPQLQVEVGGDGGFVGRVDYFWPSHRTIAEADGKGKYATKGEAIKQLTRDARLRAAGFEVVHFTWAEIMYSPEQVIAAILAAFDRADRLR
jgi:predicted transcriptional regulator of viral defense system